jgi:hypothetical protein
MDKIYFFAVAGFLFICLILSFSLWYMNKKKLQTFNDINFKPPRSDSYAPITYELTYVSNSRGVWYFLKDGKDIVKLVQDFRDGTITYIMIKSNLYLVENINDNPDNRVVVTLTDACNTTNSFIACGSVNSLTSGTTMYTTLHVLAYRI